MTPDARSRVLPYLGSLALVLLATGLFLLLQDHFNNLDLALSYLIVLTVLSLRIDTGPAIAASVVAFLCFDFFFIHPYHTLSVSRPGDGLTLFVFLGSAVLITQLAVRLRARTAEALRRGQQAAMLHELSTTLLGEVTLAEMLATIVTRICAVFAFDSAAILVDDDGALTPGALAGAGIDLAEPALLEEARRVIGRLRQVDRPGTAGRERDEPAPAVARLHVPGRNLLALPVASAHGSLGLLVVARRADSAELRPEELRLLETFANQAAIAVDRSRLSEERTRAEVLARSDELKSALLSAVSHDLRTPLASIKAAATSLLQPDVNLPEEDRRELLEAIDEEADRLNQLVANLLDLSRIESGALKPAFGWYDLSEVIYGAIERVRPLARGHRFALALDESLPLVRLDFIEIGQVLVNLLSNAIRYAPEGGRIEIGTRRLADAVEVVVRDAGIGIAPGEEERIFDAFYRAEGPRRPPGSGIGLAICRGLVAAHGGRIWATRNADRGLTVHFTLPLTPEGGRVLPEREATEVPR